MAFATQRYPLHCLSPATDESNQYVDADCIIYDPSAKCWRIYIWCPVCWDSDPTKTGLPRKGARHALHRHGTMQQPGEQVEHRSKHCGTPIFGYEPYFHGFMIRISAETPVLEIGKDVKSAELRDVMCARRAHCPWPPFPGTPKPRKRRRHIYVD